MISFLRRIWDIKNVLYIKIRNYYNLHTYFYFKKSHISVVSFNISAELLHAFIKGNNIKIVSDLIESARKTDLDKLDHLLSTNEFWNSNWPSEYNSLRYLLKLGWLINDVRTNGIKNPIQLIPAKDNKFSVHPGTIRILILTYLIPQEKIPVFYVWDKLIDPNPILFENEYTTIESPREFIKLFNKSKKFKVVKARLTETSVCQDESPLSYFEIAHKSLKERVKKFETDFITVMDSAHWKNEIQEKVYFRDIIRFYNNDKCSLSGIEFTKVNGLWIVNL